MNMLIFCVATTVLVFEDKVLVRMFLTFFLAYGSIGVRVRASWTRKPQVQVHEESYKQDCTRAGLTYDTSSSQSILPP